MPRKKKPATMAELQTALDELVRKGLLMCLPDGSYIATKELRKRKDGYA